MKYRKIGKWLLVIGILLLLLGLLLAFMVGTIATSIVMLSSILVNSAAITLLRYRPDNSGRGIGGNPTTRE